MGDGCWVPVCDERRDEGRMGKVGGVMCFFWNLVICKLDVGYSSCIHIGCVLCSRP